MHLTVRMAWHDNNWDGKVCQNPVSNTYCTGAHSLLSGRIEKKKDIIKEEECKGQCIDGNFDPSNVPPCYWSINAFSSLSFPVNHQHAFTFVEHEISDIVKPYSVFTWPFKLSFVHEKKNQDKYGSYPHDLEKRIENYINQFKPKESVVFFYANYDNPVSADEMKYLLLGCSVIAETPTVHDFPFTEAELKKFRTQDKKMRNFPKINWAIQFTHMFEKSVLLPYKEYIKYTDENPADDEKLQDMKVVIDEESLIQGFKYVSMDIDDDKCLYLLYKLRKSILKIQDHNQQVIDSDMTNELNRIETLIESVWKKRKIYPSLRHVLNHFMDDPEAATAVSIEIEKNLDKNNDLLQFLEKLKNGNIPDGLGKYEDELEDLIETRAFSKNIKSLSTLSLLNLTQYQISRIIEDHSLLEALGDNLYALYEEYVANEDDLDSPQMLDEAIDIYKIDIAMIPDSKYVKRHRKLQKLREDSKERIRSVIISYLKDIGDQGHCFDHTYNILDSIKEHPLIYKTEARIDEQSILDLDSDYKSHFIEKLYIKELADQRFFYLKDIKNAEEQLKNIVQKLTNERIDYSEKDNDFNRYINESLQTLKLIVKTDEQINQFKDERSKLYSNIYKKSFYILTGKPGAGKTYETSQVIEQLDSLGEKVVILAPTGKAALRISENIKKYTRTTIQADTIDRFIFKNKFGWVYDDWDRLDKLTDSEKITVENLVIDESSMLDLAKLKMLFSIIKFDKKFPKRLILVGDENQLPPIGYGKPFHDIITYIINSDLLSEQHYINLKSNCRQENDDTILKLADAFTDKKRGYEEAIEIIGNDGWVSKGLYVSRWKGEEDLFQKIKDSVKELFDKEEIDKDLSSQERLNLLFGLYDSGYVDRKSNDYNYRISLNLEKLQLLTPYRAGHYGTLGLNKLIQNDYRKKTNYSATNTPFYHADKIIRLSNWYQGYGDKRQLKLSNGSIGVINGEGQKRAYFFNDANNIIEYVDSEENFDLAYAISVHKAQGSDFKNVFLVIPKKRALLSKELIYTALTRSKYRLFLFIEDTEEDLLLRAMSTSHLLHRNTSIFDVPRDNRKSLIPDSSAGPVKSRIEYIIYQSLQRSGLVFNYEQKLNLKDRSFDIHPDFTIQLKNGRTIYWEHLGMLDVKKYYKDWQERKDIYIEHGLYNDLITTDDLCGIKQEEIDLLIDNIRDNIFHTDKNNKFSSHHYELY